MNRCEDRKSSTPEARGRTLFFPSSFTAVSLYFCSVLFFFSILFSYLLFLIDSRPWAEPKFDDLCVLGLS